MVEHHQNLVLDVGERIPFHTNSFLVHTLQSAIVDLAAKAGRDVAKRLAERQLSDRHGRTKRPSI